MVLPDFRLEDKVAIVTGAGRGIGKGIATALAEAGADIVTAARTVSQIEETAAEVRQMGRRCLPIPTDVTQAEQVEEMTRKTISEFGKIDILVNNAGIMVMKPLAPMPDASPHLSQIIANFAQGLTLEEWHLHMDSNITSLFLCLKFVGPYLMRQRKGKVINISSMEAVRGFTYHAAYNATKAAVSSLTRCLALEWARYNINVNAIGPGFVLTALNEFAQKDDKLREQTLQSVPLRRFGTTRDMGLLAVYLASEASNFMTGQTIVIDGGTTL